ncbi:hypothetical protein QQF64_021939, partial [Cirrhinus molitorella]
PRHAAVHAGMEVMVKRIPSLLAIFKKHSAFVFSRRTATDLTVMWNLLMGYLSTCSTCASEEKVNSPGLEVSPLKSKLQEKTEQSQQLQDQILKQQEALSRASQTLKDTRKAAGNKWHQQVERQTWWNHRRRVNQLQGKAMKWAGDSAEG